MNVTRFSKASKIPKVGTKKSAPTTTNFSKGWNTYLPNDLLEYEQVRLAQNVRFDKIGEYKTRRGLKALYDPLGTTTIYDNIPSGSISNPTYNHEYTDWIEITPSSLVADGNYVYSVELVAQAMDDSYGIPQLAIKGTDGESIDYACLPANAIKSNTHSRVVFQFQKGVPAGGGGNIKIKLGTQGNTGKRYYIVTRLANAKPEIRVHAAVHGKVVGVFEANINGDYLVLYAAEYENSGGNTVLDIVGVTPTGTQTTIYSTSTSSIAGYNHHVRFSQNLDEVRVVWGQHPYKITVTKQYNPLTHRYTYSWAATEIVPIDLETGVALDIKMNNILTGTQANIMYFDAETDTQAVWTCPYNLEYAPSADYTTTAEIPAYTVGETKTTIISTSTLKALWDEHLVDDIAVGDLVMDDRDSYGQVTEIVGQNITVESIAHTATAINTLDKFDRDFRQNFPSIKTGDPLTAMFNLGGIIYFLTRRNKYYLYSQTADVWEQHASAAQHGTFSQESVACDLNYAYYACDDGVYVFNGSTEYSLTDKTIQDFYDKIPNKTKIALGLYNNRLFVFYPSTATGENDSCLVYNINLKVWESVDTGVLINTAIGRQSPSNRFICGGSVFPQVFLYEAASTAADAETYGVDYADLGSPIFVELATGFLHFGTPSQLHRITKWRPEFQTTHFPYKVRCGYSLDYSDLVDYAFSIDLKDKTFWNEPAEWENGSVYPLINSGIPTKLTTIPKVYDQFRRCQIRYQHNAAFQPINFKSHTLCVQTQRIR